MKFLLHIEFLAGTGGTLMASTQVNGEYYVENGQTFEEAEQKLIESVKKKLSTVVPQRKEIEITL